MKEALIYFLREITDPYLLQQLLEIKDRSDEEIREEIEEAYGIEDNIEEIFKHFKNIPLDTNIKIIGLEGLDTDGDEDDVTPDFEMLQQLVVVGCDGDLYLIQLPIQI
jgi:hypothetical protein